MTLQVAPGTAEALARVDHFAAVETLQPEELVSVARWIIGPVLDPAWLLRDLEDDLGRLWSLITDDYDDCNIYEASREADRLAARIERAIYFERYRHAESKRPPARFDERYDPSPAPIERRM